MSADGVRRIVSKLGADPVQAARKARSCASVSEIEAVAADRSAAPRARAIAVLAAAEQCAVDQRALGEAVLDAVEDPAVVSAAIAAKIPQALTGALAAAPHDPVTQATRKLIAARLQAAGVGGPPVATLLSAVGEPVAAGELLAREFLRNLNEFDQVGRIETAVWTAGLVALAADRPGVMDAMCARVAAESLAALSALAELIDACPAYSDALRARVKDQIERARLLASA